MKLATIVVCLLSVVSWLSMASATPFMPNFVKQGKDAIYQAGGGDSNPFFKGMQDAATMFQAEEWQQKLHDMMVQGMEQASGQAKEQMEQYMAKFNEMKEQGASKAEFENFVKEMQKQSQS